MVSWPPLSFIAEKALAQRFITICWICTGAAMILAVVAAKSWMISMVAGRVARIS
jgi:hypothetical protein